MSTRLPLLLALALFPLAPSAALASDPGPPFERQYRFQPDRPFGATGLEDVILWGATDYGWAEPDQVLLREAFLDHLFVTGPDGALVAYGVETEWVSAYGLSPYFDLDGWAPTERLRLTGLPEGWNTLWIFKRGSYWYEGETVRDLLYGFAPKTFEYPDAPPAFDYWIETDRYWRVDYRVGGGAPGVAAFTQDLRTIDGVPTTYATVLFSEPVRLQTDDISTTVELLGAGDTPLSCRSDGHPVGRIAFDLVCEGGPVEALRLVAPPEGYDTGVAAAFPPEGEAAALADWETYEDLRFPVRRGALEVPDVTPLPNPELPEADGDDPGPFGCSATPTGGASAAVFLTALLALVVARGRRHGHA